MTLRSVAVIGIGSMGAHIARRIRQAGYALSVCDVNPQALAAFEREGTQVLHRPAACAAADLVVVLVATPQQAEAVLLGAEGLQGGLVAGHRPVVALMSTVPRETMQGLQAALGDGIGGLVDAPISGGPGRAEQGTLSVMVGGEPAVVDAIRPVLRSFVAEIFHCGPVGSGQAMKLVNNVLGIANVMLSAEAYRMALDLGLDLADAARVMEASSGRNFFSADPQAVAGTYAAMAKDRASFDALMGIMAKDIGFAERLATQGGGRFPAISAVRFVMESVGEDTYQTWLRVARGRDGAQPDNSNSQENE